MGKFNLKKGVALVFILCGMLVLSCDGTTEDPTTCNHCTVNSPWGKPGTVDCFIDEAACIQALGSGCVICNN